MSAIDDLMMVFDAFERLKKPLPDIIYHYCSMEKFISILRSKTFRLNSFIYMNDALECRWLDRMLQSALSERQNQVNSAFISAFTAIYNIQNVFLSCFSRERDLLSQWRAYADDGKGVSIGINVGDIPAQYRVPYLSTIPADNLFIHNVIYEECESVRNIKELFVNAAISSYSTEVEAQQRASLMANHFKCARPLFKSDHFREEDEWRLISLPFITGSLDGSDIRMDASLSAAEFYSRGDALCPYLSFGFAPNTFLREICLGPKNRTDWNDMKLFLSQSGFPNCVIEKSKGSYRGSGV